MATVTRKGQITLPKKVRDALGLIPGSKVAFEVERGRVWMSREPIPDEVWNRWIGHLKDHVDGKTVDEMMEELRGERSRGE